MIVWKNFAIDLLMVGILALWAYMAWRGFAKNEFREWGRRGWFKYQRFSFDWWSGTIFNTLYICGLLAVSGISFARGDMVIWQ